MAEQKPTLPHKLTLNERENLTVSGVAEVIRFDESSVILRTVMGMLAVHGSGLQLKTLSLDGGQVAIDGTVCAMIYQQAKPARSGWRRLLQ